MHDRRQIATTLMHIMHICYLFLTYPLFVIHQARTPFFWVQVIHHTLLQSALKRNPKQQFVDQRNN
jgi:hypothetical protein